MKNIIKKNSLIVLVILATLLLASCETDFNNPNAATDEQAFSSRDGILAVTVGMQQLYATTGIRWIVETPAITTREGGITTTFQNMIELEDGGTSLPNFNSNVQGFWTTMLRVMKIAEDIEANIDNVELALGTKSGIIAYSKLFKAMAIGSLAQNFEQVVIKTSNDNDATFVSRNEAFLEAIKLLNEGKAALTANPVSQEFISQVTLGNIDVLNSINAHLARYNLFANNFDAAITNANSVLVTSTSVFAYDNINLNPIFRRVLLNGVSNFRPRDNFGLPTADFVFDPADGRIAFYLANSPAVNQNGLPIENLLGFFDGSTESIPLYIPDEMKLIIAEANLRKSSPDINAAISALNEVLTDTDDVFGINANLAPYSGPSTVSALLNEVYKNRRSELFLTGLSLEDSRRFGRPQPSGTEGNYNEERNRNFYPYPDLERNSNPNTPSDPSI
jgi:hypothetical protein